MRVRVFYLGLLALILISTTALAESGFSLTVDHTDNYYRTQLITGITAKPDILYKLLTTYDHLSSINSLIRRSELLANGYLLLELESCLAFVCFQKKQTLKLSINGYSLNAVIIPEHSDFSSGWIHWALMPDGEQTIIHFSSEMVPKFWLPPWLGPLLLKHTLTTESINSLRLLQKAVLSIEG